MPTRKFTTNGGEQHTIQFTPLVDDFEIDITGTDLHGDVIFKLRYDSSESNGSFPIVVPDRIIGEKITTRVLDYDLQVSKNRTCRVLFEYCHLISHFAVSDSEFYRPQQSVDMKNVKFQRMDVNITYTDGISVELDKLVCGKTQKEKDIERTLIIVASVIPVVILFAVIGYLLLTRYTKKGRAFAENMK